MFVNVRLLHNHPVIHIIVSGVPQFYSEVGGLYL